MQDIDRSRKNISFEKEKPVLKELKPNLWAEIAKFGVNKNARTEKDIFHEIDKLRLTNKNIKKDIDAYVQTIGLSKNNKNYNYIQFKYDIMTDIINEKIAEDHIKDPQVSYEDLRLKTAQDLQAYGWSNRKASYDLTYQDQLEKRLAQSVRSGMPTSVIKKLLNLGATGCKKVEIISKIQPTPTSTVTITTIALYDSFFKSAVGTINAILNNLIEKEKSGKKISCDFITRQENINYSEKPLYLAHFLVKLDQGKEFLNSALEITKKLLQLGYDPNEKLIYQNGNLIELVKKEMGQQKNHNLKAFIDLLNLAHKIRADFLKEVEKNKKKPKTGLEDLD